MREWLTALAICAAVLLISWAVLIILARRLPPGILRDLAAFLPDTVTTMRRQWTQNNGRHSVLADPGFGGVNRALSPL
jgi:hypothetical protein